MTVPAAYVLMLGVLAEQLFGWPFWVGVLAGSLLSVVYVYLGGFNSVVRTDLLQFGLMFAGFAVLLITLITQYGGYSYLMASLPETHLTWHGGNSGWYLATWYSCGLYARAILPDLADPISSYPALATAVLPVGLLGLFILAILATVMSTVDSYSFLAATTFGNDILRRFGLIREEQINRYTRLGLVITMVLAISLALFFKSVVEIWYVFGSIGTPALLVPVLVAFLGKQKPAGWVALVSIGLGGGVSLIWWLSRCLSVSGEYWFGIEPIFPGLAVSLLWWLVFWLIVSKSGGRSTTAIC